MVSYVRGDDTHHASPGLCRAATESGRLLTLTGVFAMFDSHAALLETAQANKRAAIRDAQTRKALAQARALLANRRSFWRWIFS